MGGLPSAGCCSSWTGILPNSPPDAVVFPLESRLTAVPMSKSNAVVVSRRRLVRELLSDLLRSRCGVQAVVLFSGPEEFEDGLPPAHVVVCDMTGQPRAALEAALAGACSATSPPLLIRVDDEREAFSPEAFVRAVVQSTGGSENLRERLTPLEIEVMVAIATGLRNADVARRMRRSFKTVEKHRANLLRKLGLRSVAHLTAYAIQSGLLSADAILAARSR